VRNRLAEGRREGFDVSTGLELSNVGSHMVLPGIVLLSSAALAEAPSLPSVSVDDVTAPCTKRNTDFALLEAEWSGCCSVAQWRLRVRRVQRRMLRRDLEPELRLSIRFGAGAVATASAR
jgi:hypothetical protein